jgi:hypothetical protein
MCEWPSASESPSEKMHAHPRSRLSATSNSLCLVITVGGYRPSYGYCWVLKSGGTWETGFNYCQRTATPPLRTEDDILSQVCLRGESDFAEKNTFVEPAKKTCSGFWDTQVSKSAVNMKGIQIVLECSSHRFHQPLLWIRLIAAQTFASDEYCECRARERIKFYLFDFR